MTLEIGFLFALLATMVYLFLTEKLPVDLTAFLGLTILIFGGYLTPAEAFTGFSSPAVITMLSVFILGAALLETGVADVVGGRVHRIVGDSEVRLIAVMMIVAGTLSAFMNNIAATAVLMPAVAAIARQSGLQPSRLFMPLAFGAILGGTTTLVGTPPNILAAQLLDERGLEPFSLFDFAPVGLALLAVGTVFMLTVGRRLLPSRQTPGQSRPGSGDLRRIYQLDDRLFSIRLPHDSPLDGQTLADTRLGNTLGVKVLAVLRKGDRRLAPRGDTVLHGGDVLFVDGELDALERLLDLRGLEVSETAAEDVPHPDREIEEIRFRIPASSEFVGKSLRELDFRGRYGLVVLAIWRDGTVSRTHLAAHVLKEDDQVLALGKPEDLDRIAPDPNIEYLHVGLEAVRDLGDRLYTIRLPAASDLVGTSIRECRLSELAGLTIAGLLRGGETRLAISPDEELRAGDRLLVAAEPELISELLVLGDVELERDPEDEALESEDVGMVELAVAPRSSVAGRTFEDLDFRNRYGLLALARWREGRVSHIDLTEEELRFGDALLLHGPREKIRLLASDPDFVVLTGADQTPRRTDRAKYALGCLVAMIVLVITGLQPIHVAAFSTASVAILLGALTMPQAYRAIEWRAIFLVAAVLPVGIAMERTGAAELLANSVITVAGPLGPYPTLAALVFMASALSQGLDGAPAVVLMAPVVIQAANGLGISPYPMMMGVSLAASAAFMTPFSHKANLLVMGAGGYRSSDYLKVGTPLTVVLLALMVVLIPVFFPF
ncbi:MAG: SLC13 family permease [Gemmatimonadota bacterium]|nr:SLC13 family permease [Gemmatimonadota bacterium]